MLVVDGPFKPANWPEIIFEHLGQFHLSPGKSKFFYRSNTMSRFLCISGDMPSSTWLSKMSRALAKQTGADF
jgi:hypothetical protein